MKNNKLFKRQPADNSSRLTPFDMSHSFKFTAVAGHIIPVEADILNPGEKLKARFLFGAKNLYPFKTSAMVDIDFHVDYFFVPFFMISSNFDNMVYKTMENYSELFSSDSPTTAGLIPEQNTSFPLLSPTAFPAYPANDDGLSGNTWLNSRVIPHRAEQSTSGEYPEDYYWRVTRLSDYLGLVVQPMQFEQSAYYPWAICAYNAIYQHYFRDDEYEPFSAFDYNLDSYSDEQSNVIDSSSYFVRYCMGIRYCSKYKDYFTSRFRSPLFNDLNVRLDQGQLNSNSFYNSFGSYVARKESVLPQGANPSVDDGSEYQDVFIGEENYDFNRLDTYSVLGNATGNGLSMQQLRLLFANDKLLQLTNRNKKTYDAQVLAHLGINIPHDPKHELSHLGHYKTTLQLNQILATNGENLGEYAATGVVASDQVKHVKFTAPCHGIFMATLRIVPRYDYIVPVLGRNLVASSQDFFHKEYDNIGMRPLLGRELMHILRQDMPSHSVSYNLGYEVYEENDNMLSVNGWQYQWAQFKSGINRCTHAFMVDKLDGSAASELSSWVIAKLNTPTQFIIQSGGDVHYNYTTNNSFFLVHPQDLDNLFAEGYQGSQPDGENWFLDLSAQYKRDHFVVNGYMDYSKLSLMSTFSMPRLD